MAYSENDYAVHADFLSYMERLSAGERVIWQNNLRFLSCFSSRIRGDHNRLISVTWNGMFELYCEYDDEGNYNSNKPIGIVFECVDAQLYYSPTLSLCIDTNSTLLVLDVLRDAIRHLKLQGKLPRGHEWRKHCALAYQILRKEPLRIPATELDKIFEATMQYAKQH